MASITYTYYVKYDGLGYYVATYYLHTQPVYTKDQSGNIVNSPAPYSADSYGYDYVHWSGGEHCNSTYVSSLPSAYFNGATSYSSSQASTITLTYINNSSLLTSIVGTFTPTERFTWAFGESGQASSSSSSSSSSLRQDPTFSPSIAPPYTVIEKSLDFAFNDIQSSAFNKLQKHNDTKHATLTITYTANLLFNGQMLGESVLLPYDITESESTVQPYRNYANDKFAEYFIDHYCYNTNIHAFRGESSYTLLSTSNNAYNTAFGIVSHRTDRGSTAQWSNSYAYIFDFNRGRLSTTIYDTKNKQIVGQPNAAFGGDRLKWDSQKNKYLINQFNSFSVVESYTDPIPTTTSEKDGLMSKTSYSYVFQETGKLRTDVDALKKVTQAPCAYYVDFDTDPLFYRSAATDVKTTTYTHGNFWDRLLNVTSAIKSGLQIIGYSNKPQSAAKVSYSYINVSSSYFAILPDSPVGDNSYCIKTWYTYNSRVYNSYIYLSSKFYAYSSGVTLSYLLMAYVSPLNMQEITSSNEGTFTK